MAENHIIVSPAKPADAQSWMELRCQLWPDAANEKDVQTYFAASSPKGVALVARNAEGVVCGFAEVSIRQDWVEGSITSPVAYLEGLFVRPDCRRLGVARHLVQGAEQWALQQGLTELGSDTEISNELSATVHEACGFVEVERHIAFIKKLALTSSASIDRLAMKQETLQQQQGGQRP